MKAGFFQPGRGQSELDSSRHTHTRVHTSTHTYAFLQSPGWCHKCECVRMCVCLSLAGNPQVRGPRDWNQSLDWALLHGSSASHSGHVVGDTDPQLPQVTAAQG